MKSHIRDEPADENPASENCLSNTAAAASLRSTSDTGTRIKGGSKGEEKGGRQIRVNVA
jgi:hypothetical protein